MPEKDTGFVPDLKLRAGEREYSQKIAKMCKGNYRSHHSGHILASIVTHRVSVKEHMLFTTMMGTFLEKGEFMNPDDIN